MKKKASKLIPGNLIDLEGCPYVDDPAGINELEYAEVIDAIQETPTCVCVYTDRNTFGVPHEYEFAIGPANA